MLKKINPFAEIPEVTVRLTHPPRLGHQIQEIRKVAFAEAEGECADEFVDSLISVFVGNGVEVIDRQNLEAILDEHEFSVSGLVERGSAQRLGGILGPTALIFVKVRRCSTSLQNLQNHRKSVVTNRVRYEWIAKTTAYFKGTVQVVDLATSRIYSARTVDESLSRTNSSPTGPPEHPDQFETTNAVIDRAVREVQKMFFPWQEEQTLRYFDDKDCNLKLAYNLVKAGEVGDAVEQSAVNAEACASFADKKPKLVARSLYNLGMALCLAEDYEGGVEALDSSLRVKPLAPTAEAIAECRRAQRAAQRMEEFSEEAEEAGLAAAAAGDSEMSVDDELAQLIDLYKKKLITKDLCRKRIESVLISRGAPGEGTEAKLRNLKRYLEQGLLSQGVYEEQVARVLASM